MAEMGPGRSSSRIAPQARSEGAGYSAFRRGRRLPVSTSARLRPSRLERLVKTSRGWFSDFGLCAFRICPSLRAVWYEDVKPPYDGTLKSGLYFAGEVLDLDQHRRV